jgi:hypothetical protein
MTEMVYLESGEICLDPDHVVMIAPALEFAARCMIGFVPVRLRRAFRVPIEGEIGIVGNCRVVVSEDAATISDVREMKRQIRSWA